MISVIKQFVLSLLDSTITPKAFNENLKGHAGTII